MHNSHLSIAYQKKKKSSSKNWPDIASVSPTAFSPFLLLTFVIKTSTSEEAAFGKCHAVYLRILFLPSRPAGVERQRGGSSCSCSEGRRVPAEPLVKMRGSIGRKTGMLSRAGPLSK